MDTYIKAAQWVSEKLDRVANINKPVLFAGISCVAAFFGSFIGIYLNPLNSGIIYTGIWVAYIGLGIGASVAIVQNWYMQRLEIAGKDIARAAWLSAAGGFLGGSTLIIIQNIFSRFEKFIFGTTTFTFIIAWTVEGLIIAYFVAKAIPNLKQELALAAGGVAGFLGGIFTGLSLPVTLSDSLKGLLIGLTIALVERIARQSWIVVHRDLSGDLASNGIVLMDKPPEILLGEKSLKIGSSPECDIFLQPQENLPPILATFAVKDQAIVYENHAEGCNQILKPGEKIQIANLTIEVFSKRKP